MNCKAAFLGFLFGCVALALVPSCTPRAGAQTGEDGAEAAATESPAPASPTEGAAPTQPPPGADDTHGLVLSVSLPRTEFGPDDAVPVTYTVKNTGNQHMFVRCQFDAGLADSKGNPPPVIGVVYAPPPPPPEHYLDLGGKRVYVMEVYELPPEGVYRGEVPDVVAMCHTVPPGTYILNPKARVWVYRPETVIKREEMPHKTWVDPEKSAYEVTLTAPPISIEVKAG